ncbi:hypothetical protein M0R72_12235 [Candidatus Pacearchaeota archaeon]|jgi:hypothetical protein|nr:hypothetical protein [Candidatus Pacearchaeota archaeon]
MEIDTSIYIVALCILAALIGGRKIRKSMMPLLRIGVVLFLMGGAVAEDAPQAVAAGQQPIIAPPPEQLADAGGLMDEIIISIGQHYFCQMIIGLAH